MPRPTRSGFARYPLEYAALGLLMQGPQHGYALYQAFETEFGSIWKAGQTKFYVTLNGLLDDGMLDATTEPQEGRPARKVYALTAAGREAFEAWLHEPVASPQAARVELLAKLRFFDLLDLPGADTFIDRQVALLQGMMAEWQAERQAGSEASGGGGRFHAMITDYRIRQAAFIAEWLEAHRGAFTRP